MIISFIFFLCQNKFLPIMGQVQLTRLCHRRKHFVQKKENWSLIQFCHVKSFFFFLSPLLVFFYFCNPQNCFWAQSRMNCSCKQANSHENAVLPFYLVPITWAKEKLYGTEKTRKKKEENKLLFALQTAKSKKSKKKRLLVSTIMDLFGAPSSPSPSLSLPTTSQTSCHFFPFKNIFNMEQQLKVYTKKCVNYLENQPDLKQKVSLAYLKSLKSVVWKNEKLFIQLSHSKHKRKYMIWKTRIL